MDYELGSSNSTLGPSNSALHTKDSLRGEENILGLANDHWGNCTLNKTAILEHAAYMRQNVSTGNLTFVYLNSTAPSEVHRFSQLGARIRGYMTPGSVEGVVVLAGLAREMRDRADRETRSAGTWEMVVTAC